MVTPTPPPPESISPICGFFFSWGRWFRARGFPNPKPKFRLESLGLEGWGLGLRAQVRDARVIRFAGSWFRFKSEVLRLWDGGLCLSGKVQA